jgi:O-antigen ligase
MLAAVLLSQSAGALLIGVPVAAAAVLLLALGRRGLIAVAGLVVVGGAGLAVALRSARFARILDFSEGTNFFRLRVWQSAVEMILDHPITGIGLDQFLYFYRGRYMLPDAWQEPNLSHPHNFLLDFWLRLGILGLLVFVWVQAAFWRQAVRLYKAVRIENGLAGGSLTFALVVGMIGSMVNLLAHGLVDNSVFVNDLAYVFMFLLALNANLSTLELERKDDNA